MGISVQETDNKHFTHKYLCLSTYPGTRTTGKLFGKVSNSRDGRLSIGSPFVVSSAFDRRLGL